MARNSVVVRGGFSSSRKGNKLSVSDNGGIDGGFDCYSGSPPPHS